MVPPAVTVLPTLTAPVTLAFPLTSNVDCGFVLLTPTLPVDGTTVSGELCGNTPDGSAKSIAAIAPAISPVRILWSPTGKLVTPFSRLAGRNPEQEAAAEARARVEGMCLANMVGTS
jgi:hypothetical protein